MTLRVRRELCLGCGLCVESCPQQAISVVFNKAQIDPKRCNQCWVCLDVCPQDAITGSVPVSNYELQASVAGLRDKAESIIARIERLTARAK